jgi:hypothetical protein
MSIRANLEWVDNIRQGLGITPQNFPFLNDAGLNMVTAAFFTVVIVVMFTFFGIEIHFLNSRCKGKIYSDYISKPKKEQRVVWEQADDLVDLIRSNWCKGVLNKVSDSCCHIFEYVKNNQGKEKWGSVLDAGSGIHSLEWVIGAI